MSAHADVTVVIPCFNYGRFVADAVESALGQEGGAPAVVVVDDGSTDPETVGVLDGLERPGVRVVRIANAGPAAARNAGAGEAATPLLLMLDADDRLSPGALAALKQPIKDDPALGFAYGRTRLFGDRQGELALPAYEPYRLLHRSLVSATSLIRREAFDSVGGFDADVPGYEDWDLYLGLLGRGWEGLRVEEFTLEYRRHGRTTLSVDRRGYRRRYRALRRKHAALYARRRELAAGSDLGAPGRLAYRTFWAWRPVPASVERAVYSLAFR
jgi:glycosyltransferase involved in cell wall biosynthesis